METSRTDLPRVLIVDSDPWSLASYRETFLRIGWEALALSSLDDVKHWLGQFKPLFLLMSAKVTREQAALFRDLQEHSLPHVPYLIIFGKPINDAVVKSARFPDFEWLEFAPPPSLLAKKVSRLEKARARKARGPKKRGPKVST